MAPEVLASKRTTEDLDRRCHLSLRTSLGFSAFEHTELALQRDGFLSTTRNLHLTHTIIDDIIIHAALTGIRLMSLQRGLCPFLQTISSSLHDWGTTTTTMISPSFTTT